MNSVDLLTIGGKFLVLFASGFATGIFMKAVKRVIEKASGVGTL